MKLLEVLRKKDRTLLEMHVGMIFFGLLCQVTGAFFVKDQLRYALSLWCGIAGAMLGAYHMYRVLDKSLDQGEAAVKLIFRGYIFRYALIVLIMLIIIKTEVMNPLVVFLGYMSLKVTALIQPLTHKLSNKIFCETDPEPQPMMSEDSALEDSRQENEPLQPPDAEPVKENIVEEGSEPV